MIRSLKKDHKIFLPNGPCPLPGCLGMAFTPTRLCQGPQVSRSRPCAANLFVCPTLPSSRIGAAKATRHSSLEAGDDGPARRWPVLPRSR